MILEKKVNTLSLGAFQKSELIGWTIAGPVVLTMKNVFSKSFCWNTISYYLGFDRIWLDSFDYKWNSHNDWNGPAGQFWQMERRH